MSLIFGGVTFPLVAVGGAVPQPFTDAALPYFKDAINAYVGTAFAATMKGKIGGQGAKLACQQTGIAEPAFQQTRTTFRTPYLACYAEQGTVSERTMRWEQVETKYALCYVLPPLPLETIQEVAIPLLANVQKLLTLLIKAGGDPSHNGGARVWEQAGIASVRMGQFSLTSDPLGGIAPTLGEFPMLRCELLVVEQERYPDGSALERHDGSLSIASSDGDYPDAVQFRVIPTP